MSNPWDFLNDYKGTDIKGEWPTIPEMFNITAKLHPNRKVFTALYPEELSITYKGLKSILV